MPNGNGRNGNGRNGKVSREDYLKRMQKESKAREPTVGGSLKEGVKSALRTGAKIVSAGGMADKSRKAIQRYGHKTTDEIKRQTGE